MLTSGQHERHLSSEARKPKGLPKDSECSDIIHKTMHLPKFSEGQEESGEKSKNED